MKSILATVVRLAIGSYLAFFLAATVAYAQQATPTPTPTPNSNTTTDEQSLGDYSIRSTIEIGARGLSVTGNGNKYQSDLNYRSGFRVFDSSFLAERKQGHGSVFDSILINNSGWGSDPQGYTRVNIEKDGAYRFTGQLRRFKYFNNLSYYALGQHTRDTRLQFGDYDLTILPQNPKLKFYLGYSRDSIQGPGLTTYDFSRDEYAINSFQRTGANNWRGGADSKVGPIDLSLLVGLRDFRDDSNFTATNNLGNNPTNTSRITMFHREMPTNGDHRFVRFSAHTFLAKRLDITARYIYTNSISRFNFFEQVTGRSGVAPGNNIILEDFRTSGEIKRPYAVGEFGTTIEVTDRLRISETFRFDNFRINGGDVLTDFLTQTTPANVPIPPTTTNTRFLRTTGYRRFMNTIEADYEFSNRFSAHVGYRYAARRIRLFQYNQNTNPTTADETENNRTDAVIFGFKARPLPNWNIYFDGEHGSADSVFTRIENNQYTNFRVRSRYTPNQKLSFNVSVVTRNNNNPSEVDPATTQLPLGAFPNALDVEVRSRVFSTSVDWAPMPKLGLSAGYTHLRVTSDAGIILFVAGVSKFGQSRYFMRDHSLYFNATIDPHPRVSLFASYRISKDTGQGDLTTADPTIIIGSTPFAFQSPEGRVIMRLTPRIEWNVGYQYYNYRDRFIGNQNYHAHLPFTSLRIYFGRRE
jgi:hypothetical protein